MANQLETAWQAVAACKWDLQEALEADFPPDYIERAEASLLKAEREFEVAQTLARR